MKKFAAKRTTAVVAPCHGGWDALGSWITVIYCWNTWFPN